MTDAVLDEVREWQNRPLDSVYPIVFFDALRVKMRELVCIAQRFRDEFTDQAIVFDEKYGHWQLSSDNIHNAFRTTQLRCRSRRSAAGA